MLDRIRSKIEVDQSWDYRSSDFRLKTTILLVERQDNTLINSSSASTCYFGFVYNLASLIRTMLFYFTVYMEKILDMIFYLRRHSIKLSKNTQTRVSLSSCFLVGNVGSETQQNTFGGVTRRHALHVYVLSSRATPGISVQYKCSLEQETLECLDDSEGKAGWSRGRLRG